MEKNQDLFRSFKNPHNASQNEGPSKSTQTWTLKALLQEKRDDTDEQETSEEWLEWRSLESCGLTLSHLQSHCSTADASHREDRADTHLAMCDSETLTDFEMQLYQAIEMFHSRIRWLTGGSRKIFGMVTGSRLGVLIDTSDVSGSEERHSDLQRHLLLLLQEQLCLKKQLHFLSMGTELSSLWEEPRDVNLQRLQEVQEWILSLRPSRECDLLQALETTQRHAHLDGLLIVLRSCPDIPDVDVFLSCVSELLQEMSLSVHVVSFDSCSPATVASVKNISKASGGRFHLFSAALGVVDSSSDLEPLWAEIKAARDLLHHVQDIRQCGRLHDTPVMIVSKISADLNALSLSDAHKTAHSAALCAQPAGPLPSTSAEWLETHGLEAKKLNLYHVLAPNVYSPLKSFVPILRKNVHARVHEKAVIQFEWHDGTLKNLHVDLSLLQSYQRRLLEAERVLEDRVMWLNSTSSRQIWGTVCEQSVQVLLDVSNASAHHQLHIRHAVRLLLQEQLPNTQRFNIIAFGSDVKAWKEQVVCSNLQNLQDVWRWVLELECTGGRNTLAALRYAIETEPHSDSSLTRGVYLLTTGAPDQDCTAVSSYKFCSGLRIHVCLFTREDEPRRCYMSHSEGALILRNLAHSANGRFRWITDTGVVESDDITTLIREMEKAADYWQKSCELVDSLLQRSFSSDPEEAHDGECRSPALRFKPQTHKYTLPSTSETRLSSARPSKTEAERPPTWRPNSAKAGIPPARPLEGWKPVLRTNSAQAKRKERICRSALDSEKDGPGSVFNHLKGNTAQNFIKIPKHEDVCSSRQWLKRFGVRSLKLDLHKLLSVPACTHRTTLVSSVSRSVSAKYCAIFPSVHLNGRLRHLFLSSGELKQYLIRTERVLKRYTHRMQWLLSGSRHVFGCVLEKNVCFVLDVSGSMWPCFGQLQMELNTLIWDQLHTNRVKFSIVAFSEQVQVWQDELVEASEERCRDAVTWLGQLNTHGGTSILHALQAACVFGDSVGVYVISDGRWDCSCSLVLEEAEKLTAGKHVTIHTVTLSSMDSTAMFLKSLAHKTGGRFHQVPPSADTATARQLLSDGFSPGEDSVLPQFHGDDLKRLRDEMEKLRMFHKQAKDFREMFWVKNPEVGDSK